MDNIIALGIILIIIGLALGYIIKQKKNGNKCIGCPYANSCQNCNCKKEDL